MNRGDLRDQVREIGRFNANIASSVIDGWLNSAAIQFAKDSKILTDTRSLVITEVFQLATNEAFSLALATASGYLVSATDVVLATALENKTGAEVATALQAIIQASGVGASNTTVSYASATRMFTIDASEESGVTAITVAVPVDPLSYYDVAYKLFAVLQTDTESASAWIGGPAPFCQSERKLPSNFVAMDEVVFDDNYGSPLRPEIYKGRSHGGGTPRFYSIHSKGDGEYIKFTDHPTTKGQRVELHYYKKPDAITTGSAGDTSSYPFKVDYDYAIIHYAIYIGKLPENVEMALAHRALYNQIAEEAQIDDLSRMGGGIDMTQRGVQYG